jgi:hypothetical protein
VRPVPQLEIPPSDDDAPDLLHSLNRRKLVSEPNAHSPTSPELSDKCTNESRLQDVTDRGLSEEVQVEGSEPVSVPNQKRPKRQIAKGTVATKKAKGGYTIGKQVSGNYISYKIRSKGQVGRGRFGGGHFGKR